MKKVQFILLLGILALGSAKVALAQSTTLLTRADNLIRSGGTEAGATASEAGLKREDIPMRALRHVAKTVRPGDEKWIKSGSNFISTFEKQGSRHYIHYDKKGNWVASTKYYSEREMKPSLRKMVKSRYYDYEILQVVEIDHLLAEQNPTYIVVIKDSNRVKWVRITEDGMDEYRVLALR